MNIKTIIQIILMLGMIWTINSQRLLAEEAEKRFEIEIDYQLINKLESQEIDQISELEVISNIEIFYWYGCEACYQVETAINAYVKQNPTVSVRRTPLVARTNWRPQAYIQPLMQQLKAIENLPSLTQIYQQCLQDCERFSSYSAVLAWFSSTLDIKELPVINEEMIWQQEKDFQKRADLFSITQVPTIIINETYQVNADQAKTSKRLVEIIKFLLTK